MGSSSSTSSKDAYTKYVRYAPYVENYHECFLAETFSQADNMVSPFTNCETLDVDDAFFSTGYALSNFPSLYDMFGKFMAGLDIEIIWDNIFKNALENTEINETVSAEMALVDDETINELISFQLNMRNLNAITSSTFVIGKAIIEDKRLKTLANMSSKSKLGLISDVQKKNIDSLNWNKKSVTSYAEFMKAYYQFKPDVDDYSFSNTTRNALWPFTVMDFERAALAALLGTVDFEKTAEPRKRSTLSRGLFVLGKIVEGAVFGARWGPWGALIGATVGFNIGIGMLFLEDENTGAATRYWLTGGMSGPWEYVFGDYADE